MFVEAVEAILDDYCTPFHVRAIEKGASPEPLWESIAGAGFLELLSPESDGGAGLSLQAVFPVMACLGHHAAPVPLAQSILARALLGAYDIPVPTGMITFAQSCSTDENGVMQCPITPYGLLAEIVLTDHEGDIAVLTCAETERISTGAHGSQSATLRWSNGARRLARVRGKAEVLHACAAIAYAGLLAGAMNRVLAMSLQYANDRSQFGKSLGSFQTIQHQLAVMAQEVAAVNIAAELGYISDGLPTMLRAAVAKARTSEAALLIANAAHALHGAIGVTAEHDLQLFTRRLHQWRMAHGSEHYWNRVVGELLLVSDCSASDFARLIGTSQVGLQLQKHKAA